MSDLAPALAYLAPDEGGFTVDNGGPTNFGVTAPAASQYIGYTGAMSALTYAQATQVYQNGWWNPGNFSALTDQNVANAIFDISVDTGMGGIGAPVQAALTAIGIANDGDGQWGPDTLAAVNSADPDIFINAFSSAVLAMYQADATNNPSEAQYLNGWTNRANRLLTLQSGLAGLAASATQNPGTTVAIGTGLLILLAMFVLGGQR